MRHCRGPLRGPAGEAPGQRRPGGVGAPAAHCYASTEEVKALAGEVREIDDRLRRLETLLFHIPVPDIQRIIKVVEAAGLEDWSRSDLHHISEVEVQPEQEVAPDEQVMQSSDCDSFLQPGCDLTREWAPHHDDDSPRGRRGRGGGGASDRSASPDFRRHCGGRPAAAAAVGPPAARPGPDDRRDRDDSASRDFGARLPLQQPRGADGDPELEDSGRDPDPSPTPARRADGGSGGGVFDGCVELSGGCAREELKAQQELKDNVLGCGAPGPRPSTGEIWRFTAASRIFQLFDDQFGRALHHRMGPTKGSWWREETRSYPQLVTIISAPSCSEHVEVRGVGETATWLKGWVRLRDDRSRPLLEPDRY